jgi:hypothetical protein
VSLPRLWLNREEAIERCLIAEERFNSRDPMSSVGSGHRDEKNDAEIVLLALALKVNGGKPRDIVDSSQPILPFEDINWIFCESEKGRKMRRNSWSALEDA